MGNLTALTDSNFDSHLAAADAPVVVDFWAEWCGPCHMVSPILEEIADENTGNVEIVKLNVDENPDIARRFEVQSIPTMIVFNKGEMQHRVVGAYPKAALLDELKPYFKN